MDRWMQYYDTYGTAALGILMCVLLLAIGMQIHRTNRIRKQIDMVTQKVLDYLNCVMMEETPEMKPDLSHTQAASLSRLALQKRQKEELQSHLISSVLEEIFP